MRTRALTRPARVAAIGAAVLGLVLSATGCNAGRPPAASVEGRDISVERIDQIVAAYVEADPEQYGPQVSGEGEGTYRMDAVSAILNTVLLQMVQSELAEREGAVATDADREEATSLVETFFAPGAAPSNDPMAQPTEEQAQAQAASLAVFEAIPEDTREWLIDLRADSLALAREVGASEEELAAEAQRTFDADPDAYQDRYCLRVIVVQETDLPAVQDRLAGGEDFGALAAEVSLDESTAQAGGELGQCVPTAELEGAGLAPEVLALVQPLEVGEVSGTFPLGDGGVAIFERREATVADVQGEIVATLPPTGEAAVSELVQAEIGSIDIDIDPRFGTWDAATGTVTPPGGARAPAAAAEGVDAASTGGEAPASSSVPAAPEG